MMNIRYLPNMASCASLKFFSLFICLSLSSCEKEEACSEGPFGTNKEYILKGCVIDSKSQHYSYELFYESGQIKKKFQTKGGEYSGEVLFFYPNGKLEQLSTYRKGKKFGLCNDYLPDGQPSMIRYCHNDTTLFGIAYQYLPDTIITIRSYRALVYGLADSLYAGEAYHAEVFLPLPDSLIAGVELELRYGFKPMALLDSLVLDDALEQQFRFNERIHVRAEPGLDDVEQVFFLYLFEPHNRTVHNEFQKVVRVFR